MILSVSRRTDIPAFFGEWFYQRLLQKEVMVRNPCNTKQVSRIVLDPKTIECIVFWTKNPANFLKYIRPIQEMGYIFYFQFTLNSYNNIIEKNVPKKEKIIDTFLELSEMIGKSRIIWRYDPIFINETYSAAYHEKWFGYLCEKLAAYTRKCVISFVDEYTFLKKKFETSDIHTLQNGQMLEVAKILKNIADAHNLPVSTCSEIIDMYAMGITHNKCIDDEIINELTGLNLVYKKDPSQRNECGCMISKDVGAYGTCQHNCVYCYAAKGVRREAYDVNSPLLCDTLQGDEKITTVEQKLMRKELLLF